MKLFSLLIFVFNLNLLFSQYHLSFGEFDSESRSLEIILENSESIGGFQFQLTGLSLDGSFGGSSQESGFTVNTSEIGVVIGFSFSGEVIPPGNQTLINLSYSEIISQYTQFTNVVLSSPEGITIDSSTYDGLIDHGQPDCSGDWNFDSYIDECGVCDGLGAIYECGCNDISEGYCDCGFNQFDNCGVCGGDGSTCYFSLSLDNFNLDQKTVDVIITNPQDVMGFQFDISGISLLSLSGGLAQENEFTVSHGITTVIGFSWLGSSIPPSQNEVLTTIHFNDIVSQYTQLSNIILSNSNGNTIPNIDSFGLIDHGISNCAGEYYGESDVNEYGCCFSEIPDCNGICGGLSEFDECGICNGDGYSCLNCFDLTEMICLDSPFCNWQTDSIECSSFSSSSQCDAIEGCDWISGGGSSGGGYGDEGDDQADYRGYCSGGSVEIDSFCMDKPCSQLDEENCFIDSGCNWYISDTEVDCMNLPQEFCNLTNDCTWISGGGNGYGDGSYCSGDTTIIAVDSCGDSIILGCTIDIAENYNPQANTDDGSCIFPPLGVLSFGEIDLWVGTLEVILDCEYPVQEFSVDISGLNITGCYGGTSEDADFTMNLDVSTFSGTSNGEFIPAHSGLLFILTFESINQENICFEGSSITTSANIEYEAVLDDCLYVDIGCTDIYGLNFDIGAEYDSGECEYADHVIEAGMAYFSPNDYQIDVGESVQWNNLGGFHSVNGIVSSLSGETFNNPENFYLDGMGLGLIGSYTFDIPGIYEYDCDIGNHAEQGMVGMLTVGQGGCLDQFACNYLDEYDFQFGDCIFAEFNFDCDGNCIVQVDECGLCGGSGSNGDVNLDGEVNIIDITFLIEYILAYGNPNIQVDFDMLTDIQECIADINQNNEINISDVIHILIFILDND